MSNRRKARKRPTAPQIPLKAGGAYVLNVRHDDFCPTLKSQRMADCTCASVEQRLFDAATYWAHLQKGGER